MDQTSKALSYIVGIFVNCWVDQWLWNVVLIKLFPIVPAIEYWQMFGLIILVNSIFNYKYYSKDD